jgi:hypothetical protein
MEGYKGWQQQQQQQGSYMFGIFRSRFFFS